MEIRIKKKYLDEIKKKHTTYTLSKILSNDQAIRIFRGESNMTLKSFYKLCKAMGWRFPEQLEVIED
jgi:phosphopentomutase